MISQRTPPEPRWLTQGDGDQIDARRKAQYRAALDEAFAVANHDPCHGHGCSTCEFTGQIPLTEFEYRERAWREFIASIESAERTLKAAHLIMRLHVNQRHHTLCHLSGARQEAGWEADGWRRAAREQAAELGPSTRQVAETLATRERVFGRTGAEKVTRGEMK